MTQPGTRAQRLAMPLARDVVRELAVEHGGCVRPVQLRRTDLQTGQAEQVLVPCGNTLAALATLTTQGRAAGYCVVAALQDPRKEVLNIRNLFPDKLALRLDEPSQVDMVLGDGARDRGAFCDEISPEPQTGAGVAYVRLEAEPDPVRVRAAFVSDDDIRDMAAAYTAEVLAEAPALTAGEAA